MQKLRDTKEALSYLKEGDIITTNGKDQFVYKNEKVYCYADGNHFGLSVTDFVSLYINKTFYLYEEPITIDETKDEDYYRYYKK